MSTAVSNSDSVGGDGNVGDRIVADGWNICDGKWGMGRSICNVSSDCDDCGSKREEDIVPLIKPELPLDGSCTREELREPRSVVMENF